MRACSSLRMVTMGAVCLFMSTLAVAAQEDGNRNAQRPDPATPGEAQQEPVRESVKHFRMLNDEQKDYYRNAPEHLLRSWAESSYGGPNGWSGVYSLEAYLERGPAPAEIYLDLSLAYLIHGRFDSAIAVLERGQREARDASRFARFFETFIGHARDLRGALTDARNSLRAQGIDVSYPDERVFAAVLAANLPAKSEHYFLVLNIADAWASAFPDSLLAARYVAELNLAFCEQISGDTNVPQLRGNVSVYLGTAALEKFSRLDRNSAYPAIRMMQHLLHTQFTVGANRVRDMLPGLVASRNLHEDARFTEEQRAFLQYGRAMFYLLQPGWAVPHMPDLIIERLEDAVRRDPGTQIYSSTLSWFRANADSIKRQKQRAQAIDDARSRQFAQQAFAPADARAAGGTSAGERLVYDLLQALANDIIDEVSRQNELIGALLKQVGCVACWGSGRKFFSGDDCPACGGSGL